MTNSAAITAYWNAASDTFDNEPDHGLNEEHTRAAWAARLNSWLPTTPVSVLDVGCGTGSLSKLLAESGHHVAGVDIAAKMVDQAWEKLRAAGLKGRFLVGDAADPPTGEEQFDVLLSRHLVWTLPDPQAALRVWTSRLRPGGLLILMEGRWREAGQTGAPYVAGADTLPWHRGITADSLAAAVRPLVTELSIENLSADAGLWGGPVTDERYALIARV